MRVFIAIDLPESVRAALARQQAAFRSVCPDARWVQSQGIHLTLKFLGEVSESRVIEVSDALAGLESFKKFEIEVKGFGFFPDPRRPRVFWTGVEAPPALGEMANRVETAMEQLGFAREKRPFTPHLTLARFNVPRPQPALQALIEREGEIGQGRFEVSDFFLFESRLSPAGADYRKVERFPHSSAP